MDTRILECFSEFVGIIDRPIYKLELDSKQNSFIFNEINLNKHNDEAKHVYNFFLRLRIYEYKLFVNSLFCSFQVSSLLRSKPILIERLIINIVV